MSALTLGTRIPTGLGDRAGIVRMASADCPMDESLAWVALDFSGRPYAVIQVEWHGPSVGGLPVSLFAHFLESFALKARCNLHAAVRYGRDDHHQAEAIFKALARALMRRHAHRPSPCRAGAVQQRDFVLERWGMSSYDALLIDAGTGNLHSVHNAMQKLGYSVSGFVPTRMTSPARRA